MKSDITQRLLLGVTSGMFVIIVGMMGVIWNDIKGDIREVKSSTAEIQKEYYRIAVLEASVQALSATVIRHNGIFGSKLDQLNDQINELRSHVE